MRIITAGEPMALLIAEEERPLEAVERFSAAVAGAELNVAIGLTRLGQQADYCTRLGRDVFGKRVLLRMEREGLTDRLVAWDGNRPTGFMLKGKVSRGDPPTAYFRRGSAASAFCREEAEAVDLSEYDALHLTGILPALSASTRDAAFCLMERARAAGMTIFFDPNLRPTLWESREVMADTLNRLAAFADYLLPGAGEGEILMGSRDPAAIAAHYRALGIPNVIVKTGKSGAYAASEAGVFSCPTYREDRFVDTVGAGDGFAAGVISAIAEGLSLHEAVLRGNAVGTLQIQSVGDNDGLPTREQLLAFQRTHALKEDGQ